MDLLLDVRELEPPQPLERVLDGLSELAPGDRLRVILRREPFPLYGFLQRLGYAWETHPEDDRYEVLIWAQNGQGLDGADSRSIF